jgi:hypothetical protein
MPNWRGEELSFGEQMNRSVVSFREDKKRFVGSRREWRHRKWNSME